MVCLRLLLAAFVVLTGQYALADEPAGFKDKRIEVTVGYGPGGGPDATARVVARHLGRFIPGNPTLIVVNRPGAEGLQQTNYMAHLAPTDGLSIGYVSRASALHQISNRPGVRFDMAAFQWIGALSQQDIVVFARREKHLGSIEDMKKSDSPIIFAVRATGGTDFFAAKALEALGVPMKIVSGYGSGQTTLAFEQGEIDAAALSENSFNQRAEWSKPGGLAQTVVKFGSVRPDGAAFGADLVPLPGKSDIYALINKALALPVATFTGPPGMPGETVRTFRQAFGEMVLDPQFLDDARRADIEINPVTGADLNALFRDFLNAPARAKEEFATLVR